MEIKQKRRHDEDKLCFKFNDHCNIYFPRTPGKLAWTHIANEGRSPQEGDKLKKMGVDAGWFDFIFMAYPNPWKAIFLEAKVHGRDYSSSQKRFDFMTTGMPIFKAKFYSVQEGHEFLIKAGVEPIKKCLYFDEPNYQTWDEKLQAAIDAFAPLKD